MDIDTDNRAITMIFHEFVTNDQMFDDGIHMTQFVICNYS